MRVSVGIWAGDPVTKAGDKCLLGQEGKLEEREWAAVFCLRDGYLE